MSITAAAERKTSCRWLFVMAKNSCWAAKLALGFFGICLLAAGLARPVLAAAPQPVRLMLQWSHQAQFAGYYVALEKGFYKQQGLDVSIIPGGPGLDPADFLIRGEVDFASLWLSTALTRSEQSVRLAQVAQIRANLADRVIRAPFGGVLGIRQVSPGALVTPGTAIATLDDISRVFVDFPLPERPMMMNVSPCLISRETFFMATTASSPLSSSSTSSSFSTSEEETLMPFFLV